MRVIRLNELSRITLKESFNKHLNTLNLASLISSELGYKPMKLNIFSKSFMSSSPPNANRLK